MWNFYFFFFLFFNFCCCCRFVLHCILRRAWLMIKRLQYFQYILTNQRCFTTNFVHITRYTLFGFGYRLAHEIHMLHAVLHTLYRRHTNMTSSIHPVEHWNVCYAVAFVELKIPLELWHLSVTHMFNRFKW